jgi:sulfur-oxidizing protein SoxB
VRYRLLPVFSELLKPDPTMAALIEKIRMPHVTAWSGKIAITDRLLYRRGNFTGTVDQLICAALRREFDTEIAISPGFRWGASFLPNQPLTMEDVLAETAITYPETYVQKLTGGEIKNTLEDVCDNLFNSDPYYQQGGDMVRIGGLTYCCTPSEKIGRRISDLKLYNGRAIAPDKRYTVAGWAAVNAQQGIPVWDVLAKYLGAGKPLEAPVDGVALRGVSGNPGIADRG